MLNENKIMSRRPLEERFGELCTIVQNLPKEGSSFQLSNDSKLKFYSYYKQATVGDCNTPQPYFFNVVERAKWDAWDSLRGLSKEHAMQDYIDEMKEVLLNAPSDNEITKKITDLVNS